MMDGNTILCTNRVDKTAHTYVWHTEILAKGILHKLIKQNVVLIAALEVDIEGYGRENPYKHILVGQECEQTATNAVTYCPIGEYGQPADI